MASGNTLATFMTLANQAPDSNYATVDRRNGHYVLDFDDTVAEAAIFADILSRNYSGGGITAYIHWGATSAVSGTGGWTVEFERVSDSQQDVDSDGFATAQTVTAANVPATSGHVKITSVNVSNGANMDSIAVGELFRLRVKRDVANDTAVGDLELYAVELKET